MLFYQIHVFLRCFISSPKTSLFTVILSTRGKPYNLLQFVMFGWLAGWVLFGWGGLAGLGWLG